MTDLKRILKFEVPNEHIVNSNTSYGGRRFFVKMNHAIFLRELGYEVGFQEHPESSHEQVKSRKEVIEQENERKIVKSRITKALKKKDPKLKGKDLAEASEIKTLEKFGKIETPSSEMPVKHIFNKFKVRVLVSPPTRRRLDPVNLYPTVKHLVDGLTDAALWEDDDWGHLVEMSFVIDEKNDTKTNFIFTLVIEEIAE